MQLIRQFESKSEEMYKMAGKIRGFFHVYNGQEAIAAGCMTATNHEDPFITGYRDHGLALAKGMSPNAAMAELYGKATGCSKGKGGSMHLFDKANYFFGGHGIVGGQVPLGAGIAFAEKYNKTGKLCICYMGDGAVRQGAFHEALNLAMTWKLPAIFVIENNGYGLSTPTNEQYRCENLADKGVGFGMESHIVDGNNILEVVHLISELKASMVVNPRPVLLEFKTFRMRGHEEASGTKYVPQELMDMWAEKDPIENFKEFLLRTNVLNEETDTQYRAEIKAEIDEHWAITQGEPDVVADLTEELNVMT